MLQNSKPSHPSPPPPATSNGTPPHRGWPTTDSPLTPGRSPAGPGSACSLVPPLPTRPHHRQPPPTERHLTEAGLQRTPPVGRVADPPVRGGNAPKFQTVPPVTTTASHVQRNA